MKKLIAAFVFCGFFLTACSDMFQDRVPMQIGTRGTTLFTLFSTENVIEKLEAPKQVFATNGEYNNKVIVTWEPVKGAASYTLERAISDTRDAQGNWKEPEESDYEFLEHSKFIEATTYTDTIIDDSPSNRLNYSNDAYNYAYFYRVTAENSIKGYESSDYVYTKAGTLLAPPMNVKASCGADKTNIKVTWTQTYGSIASYRIYRSSNEDGSGASQAGTEYGNATSSNIGVSAEQQGVYIYFTVVSVAPNGSESVPSSVAMGYTLKEGAPAQVKNVQIVKGRGDTVSEISIKWDSSGSSGVKYRVYRYTSNDASLKLLNKNGTTDTTYLDKAALKPNVFYYYQVLAFNEVNGEELKAQMSDSGDDAENPADIAEAYLLSPPQSITVKKGETKNTITFSAAIGSEYCAANTSATKKKGAYNDYDYVIYGSNSASTGFAEVASLDFDVLQKAAKDGYYIAEDIKDYKFYKMITRPKGNSLLQSIDSAVVAPAPTPVIKLTVTKNAALDGYTNSDSNANANKVHAVKLFWQAPDGVDGGYHIYRSTKPDSGFKKITESPITETTYIYKDEQAKAGNYYYFKVISLNSLGQGDLDNPKVAVDYGYGALTTYQYVKEYIKTTLNSQKKLTLMHKSGNTAKLGQETAQGAISGTLSYDAHVSGVSGRVIMQYTNYADFYIMGEKDLGVYFLLNGNTNTSAGMDTNGTMDGTVQVQGMYPGSVSYNAIQIKGGAAGGGTYGVTRKLAKYKSDGTLDSATENITVQETWTTGEK